MNKLLYDIKADIPPYVVPKKMYAYVIRPERHGNPISAFQQEVIDVPEVEANEVLIKVCAAGINYNGVWAALGKPYSPTSYHGKNFHIAGSDASGIVWKIGSAVNKNVLSYTEGDAVVLHCGQSCGMCDQCNGGDPTLCLHQKIWGYETPFGSFAQFTVVKPYQILPKPRHLNWAESAGYILVLATSWRMLYGHYPHVLKPFQNVLVWGGAGGLGMMAIQIIKNAGANAIAIVSSEERGKFCLELGAKGYINRNQFDCWRTMPQVGTQGYTDYLAQVRKLRKAIWGITGASNDVDIVFEHVGEKTFPASCYLVKKGGMVVYCGATSGFNLSMDASYGWMHQKRIQGSHFANFREVFEANKAVCLEKIRPILGKVFSWEDLPYAHKLMQENSLPPGLSVVQL